MVSKVGEGLDSNIVGVTSRIGIVDREATIDLANGVGLGLTLAIAVDSMAITIVAKAGDLGEATDSQRGDSAIVESISITLAVAVDSMAIANSMMSITVADGAIAIDTAIAIVHSSDDAIAIAMSDLADGVWLSLSLGLTLAIAIAASKAGVGLDSNIVGVTSGVGIVDGEATIDLADGVGLSLTLAIAVDSMAIAIVAKAGDLGEATNSQRGDSAIVESISITLAVAITDSMSSIVATVPNGAIARDQAMAIVHSSDDAIAVAMADLPDGVGLGLGLCVDSGCSQKKNGDGSHPACLVPHSSLTSTGPH